GPDAGALVGPVGADQGAVEGQDRVGAGDEDAAAAGGVGRVVGDDVVVQRQVAEGVQDAATAIGRGVALRDRQAGDGHHPGVVQLEDAEGVGAADDQVVRPGAGDGQRVGDHRQGGGQRDGAAVETGGEGDGVGGGVRVGREDGRSQ